IGGANQREDAVRSMRHRGPDLLTVDDVVIAGGFGLGLERREVGTGARLRIALRPMILAGANPGKVHVLLLLRAEPHQDGANELGSGSVVGCSACTPAFDFEDVALNRGPARAAVVDRPIRYRPTFARQRPMKMDRYVGLDDEPGGEVVRASHRGRNVFAQKSPHLVAKGAILCGQTNVHRRSFQPATASSPSAAISGLQISEP